MRARLGFLALWAFVGNLGNWGALAQGSPNCSRLANIDIEYTLNLFANVVDTHDFSSLAMVFSSNAVANFSTSAGSLDGLPMIEQYLRKSLGNTVSQHALSTHVIRVLDRDCTSASAITYLQGSIFGQGNETGTSLTTFGL